MATQVVKVKRVTLESCMTCPLCKKLLRDATTISLCLHTFCRKCIFEKLSDEGLDWCPVCDIKLGCLPVDKLRPDHNLQDIRAKIFPSKRRKIEAPEVMPSISLPVKRKERSLSSLVVSTPKVSMQTGLTARRIKANARRAFAFRVYDFTVDEPLEQEDFAENHPSSSSSPDSLNKASQNRRKESSVSQRSGERRLDSDMNDLEDSKGKADLWMPLNCLVEAANGTKSAKSNPLGLTISKHEPPNPPDCHPYMLHNIIDAEAPNAPKTKVCIPKAKSEEHEHNTKLHDGKNKMNLLSRPVKRKRLHAAAEKRAAAPKELGASGKAMLNCLRAKGSRRNIPIWFSLVASKSQKGDSLPQISACYLRIKDGKMPVSFIQKYLVKKLDLTSESEVEIMCRGQPVLPTEQLCNLVQLWFRTASTSRKIRASVGSSANEFVMVLSYCRKVHVP